MSKVFGLELAVIFVISMGCFSSHVHALDDEKAMPPPGGKRIKTNIPGGGAEDILKQKPRNAPGAVPQKRRLGVTGACRDQSGRIFQPSEAGYDYCTNHSNQNENQVQIQTKVKEW